MDDVHDLASNHTKTLNAMNDKINLFQARVDERFVRVDERFTELESEMRGGFTRLESEMREGFTKLGLGQAQITALLTMHLRESEKEADG